jgi:hypothetical protein
MKKIIFLFIVLFSITVSAQKIELIGNKYFINGEQVPTYEIKQKMKDTDYTAYANFKSYTNKSSWGGFLLGFGGAMLVADAVKCMVSDETYPTAFSAIGAASLIASYPVLKGRNKKRTKAIDVYNQAITEQAAQNNYEIGLISNNRGLGLQIIF